MSEYEILWNNEEPVTDCGIDVPKWIKQDINPSQVAAIIQGGCASGAYMPAVTYHTAQQVMSEHGDDVLDFIQNHYGELPAPDNGTSWSGMAVHYLSCAVELWALSIEEELKDALEEAEEAEEDEEE